MPNDNLTFNAAKVFCKTDSLTESKDLLFSDKTNQLINILATRINDNMNKFQILNHQFHFFTFCIYPDFHNSIIGSRLI